MKSLKKFVITTVFTMLPISQALAVSEAQFVIKEMGMKTKAESMGSYGGNQYDAQQMIRIKATSTIDCAGQQTDNIHINYFTTETNQIISSSDLSFAAREGSNVIGVSPTLLTKDNVKYCFFDEYRVVYR